MVDFAMPLGHFAFATREERVRHERDGTPGERATDTNARIVGHMPIDPVGYPYMVELAAPDGCSEIVFASSAGRIAGRPGQYVANRGDTRDTAPAGARSEKEEGPAPVAQHIEQQYGSVEIPKGK
jgi:hypothetical protein